MPCNHDLLQQYPSYKTAKDPTVLIWHMLLSKIITRGQKTSENENFDTFLQSDSNQMTFFYGGNQEITGFPSRYLTGL